MASSIPATSYVLTEGMIDDLQILATQNPNKSDVNSMLQVIRTSSALAQSILDLPPVSLSLIQQEVAQQVKKYEDLLLQHTDQARGIEHWKAEAEAYSQRAAALEADLTREKANADHLRSISAGGSRPRIESIPDPEIFDGSRDKLRSFIAHLRLKIHGDGHKFPDVQHQLRYAAGRLSGIAFDQVLPLIQGTKVVLSDLESFVTLLENAFGDPDRMATAERKLENLKQRNQDFASYYAEFQRYIGDVDWNEGAKRSQLTRGLNNELKDQLVTVDAPSAFTEYVTRLQHLDNLIRARAAEKTSRSTQFRSGTTTVRNPVITSSVTNTNRPAGSGMMGSVSHPPITNLSTQSGTHSGPMDLSSIRRRLTPEQKALRIREGRCLYCGGFGHMALSCPVKLTAHPLRASEVSLSFDTISAEPIPNAANNTPFTGLRMDSTVAENELSQA